MITPIQQEQFIPDPAPGSHGAFLRGQQVYEERNCIEGMLRDHQRSTARREIRENSLPRILKQEDRVPITFLAGDINNYLYNPDPEQAQNTVTARLIETETKKPKTVIAVIKSLKVLKKFHPPANLEKESQIVRELAKSLYAFLNTNPETVKAISY